MKAWDIIGIIVAGESVCCDCMDEHEVNVINEVEYDSEIGILFASEEGWEDYTCGRCGKKLKEAVT